MKASEKFHTDKRFKGMTDIDFIDYKSDTIYDFKVYIDFTCADCQRVNAILNYYKISFKRSTSWFYLRMLKNDLKNDEVPNIADFSMPAMKVTVSMQQPIWIFGENDIINYLEEHYMIGNQQHYQN